jgi:CheY-like chemotaxis protein
LGLGLTLVKNLVEMHDGTVEARSLGLGHGSEFIVRLPLLSVEKSSASSMDSARSKKPPVIPRRVLVVDDHHDSANSLSTFLRMKGHAVETAYDGLEAVEKAAKFHADVVLMDLGMPHLNGYEAAQRIREQGQKDLTLVAVSGWGQEEDRRRSDEAGFNAHLIKPVDMRELQKLIADAGGNRGKEVALK